jgi:ribonucleoside-diphosphate reductase alpha chain
MLICSTTLFVAYRLAIAPTQSISYVQNATSSVMPIVDQIERRTYGNAETTLFVVIRMA